MNPPLTRFFACLLSLSSSFCVIAVGQEVQEWEATVTDGRIQLSLPAESDTGHFRQLEWSSDLGTWEQVARNYGYSWENVFPETIPVLGGPGAPQVTHPVDNGGFFRISVDLAPLYSNAELVSRFFQQATFGPTRELIATFPGINSPSGFNDHPYTFFRQWIEAQMAMPASSLRKFWRERSNPAFTNNSQNSPFEVGHNSALGTQLSYWINGQDRIDPSTADAIAAGRPSNDVTFSSVETKQIVWYQMAITAPDALRQRAAWALSQIFVLGEEGSVQVNASERFLVYYDIFIRHAFGNFRDILGEVTFNPCMGDYLTYIDNRKADPILGTFPDENYAREVMQLFTIGLWMLNQDGTAIVDESGNGIPSYDNDDIFEFAKVFTGLRKQGNRTNIEIKFGNFVDPLRMQASWHDFSPKTFLDGSTIGPFSQTDAGGIAEVNAFLDLLFNHPNTPPFIARKLIQRLTVSNPSPNYIHAVAQAFVDGTYGGTGTGRRGDLAAVFKAILLHPEAREPALSADAAHGKLREPLVRLLHYARAFQLSSLQTYGLLPFWQLDQVFGQSPFDYPSVFNFYLPDYQPTGIIQNRGLFSPEFEITTDVTSLGLANAIRTLVYEGITDEIGLRGYSQGGLNLSHEISLAADTNALIDHLNLMLAGGRLTPQNRQVLFDTITAMPGDSRANLEARVKRALSLISLFPEFNVLY